MNEEVGDYEVTQAEFNQLIREVSSLVSQKRQKWKDQKLVFYNLDLKLKRLGSVVIEESNN